MIQVTDNALDKMEELRDKRDADSGQGMTLLVTESNQLAVTLGEASDEDQVFEREGEPIVIVPDALTTALDGLVLDHNGETFELGQAQ